MKKGKRDALHGQGHEPVAKRDTWLSGWPHAQVYICSYFTHPVAGPSWVKMRIYICLIANGLTVGWAPYTMHVDIYNGIYMV